MGTRAAEYVRDIQSDEPPSETVSDAKALTFEHFCEHAVLELDAGRIVLVKGGPYGIDLECESRTPTGHALFIRIDGRRCAVRRLVFHVHPKPTGPSDDDLRVLEILGQDESMLYEIYGPAEGTVIRPKTR